MASFGVYVPDGSPLLEKIQERADRFHDGRVSAYLRAAVERDLAAEGGEAERMPSPVDPHVMEKLARVLLGHLKGGRMAAMMDGRDQVAELTEVIERRIQELERTHYRAIADEAPPMAAEPPPAPYAPDPAAIEALAAAARARRAPQPRRKAGA
jgi:hypothetical protein